MHLRYQNNCKDISWTEVPRLLEKVGMSFVSPELHKQSFEASYSVLFVFDEERLIAFGRIISDRVRQSAICDVAVNPNYQGQRLGKEIVIRLMDTTPNCNFILYASLGKEGFYKTMGFLRMTTAMARFANNELMVQKGFLELETEK